MQVMLPCSEHWTFAVEGLQFSSLLAENETQGYLQL